MQIRSVTVGQTVSLPVRRGAFAQAGDVARTAKAAFEAAGYPVQTTRVATQPLSLLMAGVPPREAAGLAVQMEDEAARAGIDYCSLGPVLATSAFPRGDEAPSPKGRGSSGRIGLDLVSPLVQEVPAVLAATRMVFLSVLAAARREGMSIPALREAAAALVNTSAGDVEGFRSLRFTLSANVPPNGPFFPSAYHDGGAMGFTIALEAADLAVDAFTGTASLAAAEAALTRSIQGHGRRIQRIAEELAATRGCRFHGIDISLAPYPEEGRSIAAAMERLGAGVFGASGTLFAASFITGILARVDLPKCGFSGLMIPLLEDSVMAQRHAEGAYTLDSLLLYSAVCGAGLDTIPIPGDAAADQIASVYVDMCALSLALDKPLTARLMPLPGKKAGDAVRFAFPYFAPTRVVALSRGSPGMLDKGGWVRGLGSG